MAFPSYTGPLARAQRRDRIANLGANLLLISAACGAAALIAFITLNSLLVILGPSITPAGCC